MPRTQRVGSGPWANVASCGEDVEHVHNCNITQGGEGCQNLNLECDTESSGPPFWGLRMIQSSGRKVFAELKGRLEVNWQDEWGTVCDDMWNYSPNNAKVACRNLGLPGGVSMGNNLEDGNGRIWLDDLMCTGYETTLEQCPRS